MHQLIPAEPQTVRRKRKTTRNDDVVCAANSQIQIVNSDTLGVYHHDSSEMSTAPEFVDVEQLLCDDSVRYRPIVIYQNELIDDGTNVVNVDPSSELIVIEDEDDWTK